MGVPRLFKYIKDNFSGCVLTCAEKDIPAQNIGIDCLYIDANAILHPVAQHVFNYGSHKFLLEPINPLTTEQKKVRVFELFFQRIVELSNILQPRKLLYIALDGCAPFGKCVQQRTRRFLAAQELPPDFNPNCLTVGTRFMYELTVYLNYAIRKKIQNDLWTVVGDRRHVGPKCRWNNIQVIFSPPSVHGEGEAKCLEHIRSIPEREKLSHCICGPDGDLAMLTLAAHCPKMCWFRNDPFRPGWCSVVDAGALHHALSMRMKEKKRLPKKDVINDFILLGFFVGNDFLPKIPMFHYLEEGVAKLMEVYHTYLQQKGCTITRVRKNISTNLACLIRLLAIDEAKLLEQQLSRPVADPRFVNQTLIDCSFVDIIHNKHVLDYKKYRNAYYKKMGIETQQQIDNLCEKYMQGLVWVYEYYTKGCPCYAWSYGYHYAPLFKDFSAFLEKKKHTIEFSFVEAPSPFQQLLCVLPPSSSNLLPREFRSVMHSTKSLLAYAFPKHFEIDYEGVHKEYQGIVLLPFINFYQAKKAYHSVQQKKKYNRNNPGKVSLFTFEENNKKYKYKCCFGIIENCQVSVTKLH